VWRRDARCHANKENGFEKIRTVKARAGKAESQSDGRSKPAAKRRTTKSPGDGARAGGTQSPTRHGRSEPQGATQLHRSDSRVMAHQERFIHGYNAQPRAPPPSWPHQIIVAHHADQLAARPNAQFAPLLRCIKANLGTNPDERIGRGLANCSQANLRTLFGGCRGVGGRYVRHRTQKHGTKAAPTNKEAQIRQRSSHNEHKSSSAQAIEAVIDCESRRRSRVSVQIKQARAPPVPPSHHRQCQSRMFHDLHAHNLANPQPHAEEKLVSPSKNSPS